MIMVTRRGNIRFEEHPYCGPLFVNKDGSESKRHVPESHPFWDNYEKWVANGKRTANGFACLTPEAQP